MQVKPQEVSVDKATTPRQRARPTLASHRLDLPSICSSNRNSAIQPWQGFKNST